MTSFILNYNGSGATPAAIINEGGIQWPNAAVVVDSAALDAFIAAHEAFVQSLAHPDSGLANVKIQTIVENSGPNAGDDGGN